MNRKSFIAGVAALILSKAQNVQAANYSEYTEIIAIHDLNDHNRKQAIEDQQRHARVLEVARAGTKTQITPYELRDSLLTQTPIAKPRPFIATYDDGFESHFGVLDELIETGIKPVFFLCPGNQDGTHQYAPVSKYKRAREKGAILGAHGEWHIPLTSQNIENAVNNMVNSKVAIEQATGEVCDIFAFPEGMFSDELVDRLSEHFTMGFSTAVGVRNYGLGRHVFSESPAIHFPENIMCLNRQYGL